MAPLPAGQRAGGQGNAQSHGLTALSPAQMPPVCPPWALTPPPCPISLEISLNDPHVTCDMILRVRSLSALVPDRLRVRPWNLQVSGLRAEPGPHAWPHPPHVSPAPGTGCPRELRKQPGGKGRSRAHSHPRTCPSAARRPWGQGGTASVACRAPSPSTPGLRGLRW